MRSGKAEPIMQNKLNKSIEDTRKGFEERHIKFYTKKEWQEIAKSAGLNLINSFDTHIRFPKKKQDASELDSILNRFDKQVIKGYVLEIMNDEIWITERVNNLLFRKL